MIKTSLRIGVLFCLQFAAIAQTIPLQTLSGHVPAVIAHLTPLGRLPATNVLHLVIGLPLRNRGELTNLMQRLYDPASPDYRHYLTPEQFTEKFGPTKADYQAVSNFAVANGLKVTGTHPNRTLLDVSGSVSNVEKTFHVTLHVYQHPTENRTFFAPDVEPSLYLTVPVLHIGGLDNYVIPRPAWHKPNKSNSGKSGTNPTHLAGSGPNGNYMGNDFRAAYVPGVALTGAGQSVGLFECDGYYASDITTYEAQTGLPNVTLTNVLIDGFDGVPESSEDVVEVSLDIEMAISMAPGLTSVIVYEVATDPVTDGSPPYLYDMVNRMATDNLAKQISSSWVWRSDPSLDQVFQEFAIQGQSFFQASGDEDAYTSSTFQWEDDPNVILVGGTTLTTSGPGGAYVSETVWNWGVEYGEDGVGSGGGISTSVPIPIWQQGINMTGNGGSTTLRNIPDVALTADNVYVLANQGETNSGIGGTSCAAPLWAGFTALVNQQAVSTSEATVGFINPAIYAIGQEPGYASIFNDITTGNNTWSGSPTEYYAEPGYDLCTGWGTPTPNLINALAPPDVLRISPVTGFFSVGGVGGPFSATSQTFTVTNAGATSLNWMLTNSASWLNVSPTNGTLVPGAMTTVTVSLNAAASNLAVGNYSAPVWFTNLSDGVGQIRLFILDILTPPVITSPPANQAVLEGAPAFFAVGATGPAPLSFQWQQNGTNLTDGPDISGSATTNLTISSVFSTNVGSYTVVVANPAGAVTSTPPALLTITPSQPVITSQPVSQATFAGATALFTVAVLGNTPLSFQWYYNNAAVTNATNATLALPDITTNQAGTYYVVITNIYGSTNSSNAVLSFVTNSTEGITFDDLTGSETAVPADYNNLTWSNFYYLDALTVLPTNESGFYPAMISPPNVAYDGYGTPASISGSGPFILFSAYLTAVWNDNLQVEAQGYVGSALVYDNTYTLSATAPTLINFNYIGVTSVVFIPSGGTVHPGYIGSGEHFAMDNVTVETTPPTPTAVLYAFTGPDGGNPSAPLVQGTDGNFYGTTPYGGANGDGTVFKMTTNGALTTLLSFNNSNGANPYGALVQGADGNFYGTTANGGTDDDGTVFKMTTNGTLTSLYSFNNTKGANPSCALVQGADGKFYGTTENGGANDDGTVFKITSSGTLTSLFSFDDSNGSSPAAALVQGVNGIFYGTTLFGGPDEEGTVFSITTNGTLTSLASFNYSNGAFPYDALVQGADGNYYGTTIDGGDNYDGEVFKITTNGTLTTIFSFNDANGASPYGGLALGADGNLYGTTEGGAFGFGTIFQMTTNGTLNTLFSFEGANGSSPYGLMQGADGYFYCTTVNGGVGFDGATASGDGTVFRFGAGVSTTLPVMISQPSSQVVPVGVTATFSVNASGAIPLSYTWQLNGANIFAAITNSYTVNNVQLSNSGEQFRCVISNTYGSITSSVATLSVFTASGPLYSYHASDGGNSSATLIQATNGNFYGTTEYGGAYGEGTVFSLATNGTLTTLISFNFNNGAQPAAGLVLGTNGNFYGTTENGGLNGFGTVFSLTTNGALTTLYSFAYTDGASPGDALIQGTDGNFYGTTSDGGTNGYGTVFNITTNGVLTTLYSFDYNDGGNPYAALAQGTDGNFYGTTAYGGTDGDGTVFKITTNGTLTTLHSFDYNDGFYPSAALVQGTDGNFYGTTQQGGADGDGTIFKITTTGTLTTLLSFNYSNGDSPAGAMMRGTDGNFYGTTEYGGTYGNGMVFKMTTSGTVTTILSFEGTNGASPQAAPLEGSDGGLYVTTSYGGVGFDGSSTSGNGTVFRLAGVFPYIPPSILTQPSAQLVAVGGSAAFSVTASGTAPLSFLWSWNGVPIAGATNSQYTINNVQLTNAGVFSVRVTNISGTNAVSSNALLSVQGPLTNAPGGIVAPAGLVNWWPADGNAIDIIGADNGTPQGNMSYVPGVSSLAFHFDGSTAVISNSAGSLLSPVWTACMWVNCQYAAQLPAVLMGNSSAALVLQQHGTGLGSQQGAHEVGLTVSGVNYFFSPAYIVPTNTWTHLAFVGTSTNTTLYVNGVLQGSLAVSMLLPRNYVGATYGSSSYADFMLGSLDNIMTFEAALSAAQINAIYSAGGAGLICAPQITGATLTGSNQVTLNLEGQTGKYYSIYSSTNLFNWTLIENNLPNPLGTNQFIDTNSATNSQTYYWVSQTY